MASPRRRPFTSLGAAPGLAASTSAAAPDVMAAENEVPDPTKLPVPTTAVGLAT